MRNLLAGLKRHYNWIAFVPFLVFFVAVLVLSANTIAILINGLDIAVLTPILIAYLPIFWKKLRSDADPADLGLLGGLLLICVAVDVSRIWSLAIILSGKPAWMINHWFQSLCYLMVALGQFYLLRVPGSRTSRRYLSYAFCLAVVVVVVLVAIGDGI